MNRWPREPRTELAWIAMLPVLGLSIGLGIDGFITAIPTVASAFAADAAVTQLTVTFFLIGMAFGQLLSGPLSDAWGRRRPLMVCLAVSAATTLLSAAAPSLGALIALRAVTGLFSGGIFVITSAAIRDRYFGAHAAKAFSQFFTVAYGASAVLPFLSAVVLEAWGWRVLLTTVGLVSLGAFLLGLLRFGETHLNRSVHIAFVRRMTKDARVLFADRLFVGSTVVILMGMSVTLAGSAGSAFVLQRTYGLTPQQFGLMLGTNAVGVAIASQVANRIALRVGARGLVIAGLALMGSGAAVIISVAALELSAVPLIVGIIASASAMGFLLPGARALASHRHQVRVGSAFAFMGLLQWTFASLMGPLIGVLPLAPVANLAVVVSACTAVAVTGFLCSGPVAV